MSQGLKECKEDEKSEDRGGIPAAFRKSLTPEEFQRLSEFIHANLGIRMPPQKRSLLESRLQKRLRALGLDSFSQYCDNLFSPGGEREELLHMIDVVTTNKTDFMREAGHFRFLSERALPELATERMSSPSKAVRAWSAGCSTGEEPYNIAMFLAEFGRQAPGFNFSVLASDISTRVLQIAQKGIYSTEAIAPLPQELRKRYLLKSRDRSRDLVRIVPELRQRVFFRRLNLMDRDYGLAEAMDIIFCRNVVIYFDRSTQEELFRKFCSNLRPGGFLFIGHSETLSGITLPLVKVAPAVYKKTS